MSDDEDARREKFMASTPPPAVEEPILASPRQSPPAMADVVPRGLKRSASAPPEETSSPEGRRRSIQEQVEACRQALKDLGQQKARCVEVEDFKGAHEAKELLQVEEDKLKALEQELASLPTPARTVGTRIKPAIMRGSPRKRPMAVLESAPEQAEAQGMEASPSASSSAVPAHVQEDDVDMEDTAAVADDDDSCEEEAPVQSPGKANSKPPLDKGKGWAIREDGFAELVVEEDSTRQPFLIPCDVFDQLYGYQKVGVEWMARLWNNDQGGILADEMGLGKTVQVCAMLHGARKAGATHALVLVPPTLCDLWKSEARKWCPGWPVYVYRGPPAKRARALLRARRPQGGLLIVSYQMVAYTKRQDKDDEAEQQDIKEQLFKVTIHDAPSPPRRKRRKAGAAKRRRTDDDDQFDEEVDSSEDEYEAEIPPTGLPSLGERPWDIVICDEAHRMKNISTSLGKNLRRVDGKCRLLLTGTPVQNALQDMWALMDFAMPGLLGNHETFLKRFSDPISRGSVRGANMHAVQLKNHLAEQLRGLYEPFLLRRTKVDAGLVEGTAEADEDDEVQKSKLKPKRETIIWLAPSEEQSNAYQKILEKSEVIKSAYDKAKMGVEFFNAIGLLKRVCNHPLLCLPFSKGKGNPWADLLNEAIANSEAAAVTRAAVREAQERAQGRAAEEGGADVEMQDAEGDPAPQEVDDEGLNVVISNPADEGPNTAVAAGASAEDEVRAGKATEMMVKKLDRTIEAICEQSAKLRCLSILLPELAARGHRVLVFAHSLKMLDLVQICCLKPNGLKCLRMDGQVDASERAAKVNKFQSQPERFPFFLLTTAVGGVGLTLTGADRVVLVDPAWNPAVDAQAVDRAFRIGQEKEVRVYRLIQSGLIEDKMFRLQVYKMGLTKTALEDGQQNAYFTAKEIRALFEWCDPMQGETRQLLLKEHGDEDPIIEEAAFEDGKELWEKAGVVGLSDFGGLHKLGTQEEQPIADKVVAAQLAESRQKLKDADNRMKAATDMHVVAKAAKEQADEELQCSTTQLAELRDKVQAAAELFKQMQKEVQQARRADAEAQDRLKKATSKRQSAEERSKQCKAANERAVEADEAGAKGVTEAQAASKTSMDDFAKAMSDIQGQFSIVDDAGRAAGDGVADSDKSKLKSAIRAYEKIHTALDKVNKCKVEFEMSEQEVRLADEGFEEAAAGLSAITNGGGVAEGASNFQATMAKKTAERMVATKDKERKKAEAKQSSAEKKVEAANDELNQKIEALIEAGESWSESFEKPAKQAKVTVAQVKNAAIATRKIFRALNSVFVVVKKSWEATSRASTAKRKATQKLQTAASADVQAARAFTAAEEEYNAADKEEEAKRGERSVAEDKLRDAETAKATAEVEEADMKRRVADAKTSITTAKDALKAAKEEEKKANAARTQLHNECSKQEKAAAFVHEQTRDAVQTLQAETYNEKQVTEAYDKVKSQRSKDD
eukprot:TRINITY_DN1769_c0_g3_i1.p1 TRINITY_DN1769_c0_g3~~TRINITY_DN1769_c0_g3_i1.p1  ORF type:complete len:1585 (-),score=607.29 TRINITY_DN1769_c0_g3_i1:161-4564(-)